MRPRKLGAVSLCCGTVSLWDRLRGKGQGSRAAREARRREAEGELGAAALGFEQAGLGDEAARVLLLSADVESSIERRMALCDRAAKLAVDATLSKRASGRRAKMALDLLRPRATVARSELARVAEQLEAAEEHEAAAEAWSLAGDREGEIRALTAAGAIERLEARLGDDAARARSSEGRAHRLRLAEDLDRTGERLRAIELATEGAVESSDDGLLELGRAIRVRLARGPLVSLEIDGAPARYALGERVLVGRGEVAISIASRALSREHLCIERASDGTPQVLDAGSRNGTILDGARLGGAVPIGTGLELRLGGEVPCRLELDACGSVVVEIGGARYVAPLGALTVAGWTISLVSAPRLVGGAPLVSLSSTDASPAFLGRFEVARCVELAVGDALSSERGGPPRLVVLAHHGRGP
jgi:hypothetical protein